MKGERSRKRAGALFTAGHVPWNKGLKFDCTNSAGPAQLPSTSRLTTEDFQLVSRTGIDGATLATPDCDCRSSNVRLLRPKPEASVNLKEKVRTSFLEMTQTVTCW